MNEFTDKNEQAFLDACGAIGVEPNAMETESLYHSYTTRGEAQEVANGIDRMISEGH